jgi:tetratricopeptide (TPR) repeat protein
LGYLLFKQGSYRKAVENFACALALYGKMGNSTDSAWALTGIGRARLAMGEMDKAADDLETAAEMAMKAGDENILCRIEMTKAELELARGLPEKARPHVEAVGNAAEMFKARGTMAKALALQAQCEEEYDAAASEGHYKEAVSIFREYNMTYDLAETCLKLARFSATLNKKEDIDQSLKVAEEIFARIGNKRFLDEISRIRSLT